MTLRFGTFFGLTAVQAMFMSKHQIDTMFGINDMTNVTLTLVNNLYTEACSLRRILSGKKSDDINSPYVIVAKDYSCEYARNLTKGLNLYLEYKKHSAESSLNEDIVSTGFDLASIDLNTAEDTQHLADFDLSDIDVSTAEATDVFSSLDQIPEPNLAGISAESNAESEDFDLSHLFDSEEPQSTYGSSLDAGAMLAESREDYRVDDLVGLGETNQYCEETYISEPSQLVRYMLQHKSDFTDDEREVIQKQIAKIPNVPISCSVPNTFKERSARISPESLKYLRVIYAKANEVIAGDNQTRLEYLIERLELLLRKSNVANNTLFFLPRDRFNKDDSYWVSYERILENICSNYLDVCTKAPVMTNIDSLLHDCNSVLGLENTALADENELLIKVRGLLSQSRQDNNLQPQLLDAIYQIAGIRQLDSSVENELRKFIGRLISADDILDGLLRDISNLKYVLAVYAVMVSLTSQTMYRELALAGKLQDGTDITGDNITEACINEFIDFTRETGIRGLHTSFEEDFIEVLSAIKAPLASTSSLIFPLRSSRRQFAELLRRQLVSIKMRFGGAA